MSTVMRHKLIERENTGNPIKVGVIGVGFFGCSTIGQMSRTPGITVSIIADIAREDNLLPLGLAEGIRVVREIPEDTVITYDDVALDEDFFLLKLRQMQDKPFSLTILYNTYRKLFF